jgi:hypothetical protein
MARDENRDQGSESKVKNGKQSSGEGSDGDIETVTSAPNPREPQSVDRLTGTYLDETNTSVDEEKWGENMEERSQEKEIESLDHDLKDLPGNASQSELYRIQSDHNKEKP